VKEEVAAPTEEAKVEEVKEMETEVKEGEPEEEEEEVVGEAITIGGVRVSMEEIEKPHWFLFIGNLCAAYDDAKLVELFETCGVLSRCFVMQNKDGSSKGYAPGCAS
jgi:hypothetical protein